jgi:hypothetical protein
LQGGGGAFTEETAAETEPEAVAGGSLTQKALAPGRLSPPERTIPNANGTIPVPKGGYNVKPLAVRSEKGTDIEPVGEVVPPPRGATAIAQTAQSSFELAPAAQKIVQGARQYAQGLTDKSITIKMGKVFRYLKGKGFDDARAQSFAKRIVSQ